VRPPGKGKSQGGHRFRETADANKACGGQLCGTDEAQAGDTEAVASAHRQERASVETRSEGDDRLHISEQVDEAAPDIRPARGAAEVRRCQPVDIRVVDAARGRYERREPRRLHTVLDANSGDGADSEGMAGRDFDIERDETVHRVESTRVGGTLIRTRVVF